MPMAAVVIALICGILLAASCSGVSWVVWLAMVVVSVLLSLRWAEVALCSIFAFGGLIYTINSFQMLPHSEPLRLVVEIGDDGVDYGSYSTYSAKVVMANGKPCRAKVRVSVDSLLTPKYGDVIELNAKIRPFTPHDSSYAKSMYRQGYSGRVTINSYRVVAYRPNEHTRLHSRAVERLRSLLPPSEGGDVAISVTLGTRSVKRGDLSQKYSYSGASHILAVSGLHVGLVFVLLNILLLPLVLFWRGNIVRAAIVVVMIWLYVALCGYPTSAIRAAIMFTVLQLSYMAKSRHLPENSVCATAFIMLAFDPYMLFELSFSLSFTAVAAIIFVARPLIGMIRVKGVLKGIIDMVVVSTVCVIATAPLISHSFGVVSQLSILITPLVIVTAQVIIVCSLAALVLPQGEARIVAQSAEWCGGVQNEIVRAFTEPKLGFVAMQIDDATMWLCYAVMMALVVVSFGFKWEKEQKTPLKKIKK